MKLKPFLLSLILFCISASLYGQYSFDSIKICHANGKLSEILIGEYNVEVNNGELLCFSSKDSAVTYDVRKRTFSIKNLVKKSLLQLQLLEKRVYISTRDTSLILNSPKSLNLADTSALQQVLYSLGDFSFAFEFQRNKISKISFPTTGKYVVIGVAPFQEGYTWDFFIESAHHENKLLLTSVYGTPYSLQVQYDKEKIGIRLLAERKNGRITLLQGIRIYENNSFISDRSHRVKYGSGGKMAKNSGFQISCQR